MKDEEAFLQGAMERHGPAVYRLALCRLQSVPDAEDVYQDVFLRLLGEGDRQWDEDHLKAWLLRTAMNRCADLRRFRLRRPLLSLEEIPDMPSAPSPEQEALWDAVSRLPEKLRTAVHLHYGEGYRTEEIAAMLGVPAATVRTRLLRGRKKLKAVLGGMDNEESL